MKIYEKLGFESWETINSPHWFLLTSDPVLPLVVLFVLVNKSTTLNLPALTQVKTSTLIPKNFPSKKLTWEETFLSIYLYPFFIYFQLISFIR